MLIHNFVFGMKQAPNVRIVTSYLYLNISMTSCASFAVAVSLSSSRARA